MLNLLGSITEFERQIMFERQRECIAKAKSDGKHKGRAPTARAKTDLVLEMAVRGPGSLCVAPWTRAASVLHTQFITTIFDTPQGWKLIGFGTAIGFVFAVLALSVSVVSFPMLLDRPIDAEAIDVEIEHPVVAPTIDVPIAIQTSIKAVLVNPLTMALWGLIVAGTLAIGFLLMFAGLAVVVPGLAHSTWHLYRKVVEPAASG